MNNATTNSKATQYRVNYGNGQVHYAGSRKACERCIAELDHYREFAFVQVRIDGEWVRAR